MSENVVFDQENILFAFFVRNQMKSRRRTQTGSWYLFTDQKRSIYYQRDIKYILYESVSYNIIPAGNMRFYHFFR